MSEPPATTAAPPAATAAPPAATAFPPLATRTDAVRYGATMLRRFGWFYHLLGLGWLLGRLRMEEHSVDRVREAAARGPIVYVLLQRSQLEHLALNTVLNARRLPLSVWADGFVSFTWQPVVEAWRDVARRVRALFSRGRTPDPVGSGWLARTVATGAPAVLFLEPYDREDPDPFAAMVEAQALSDRPVQLVPVIVSWSRAPEVRSPVRQFIAGANPAPGLWAMLRNVLLGSRDAVVQVGDPVDLGTFAERVAPEARPRALRTLLRRYLRRETRVVRGPQLIPHREMRHLVLDNPPMRELAAREAAAQGKSLAAVRKQMEREYDAIAARFSWRIIRVLDVVLRPLWTRVFSGVDIGEDDVERIRSAIRHGTPVLVPCHKSHFDYLLLSWVFYDKGLVLPHVVAGMNLAIWPVSIVLRGAGGFFVKRSFKGERIFPAVFERYLRELVRQGWPVEFFIEGGRTRSGKLMTPKLGVLGMVLDAAALRPTNHEVTLLPISIAYEQVAEERAYARELAGEAKRAESLGQVVRAGSVLGRRFGKCYVRVGTPIPLSPLVDAVGEVPEWEDRADVDKRALVQRVGERLVYRIGQCTVVLPTCLVALALMSHHRRGIRQVELLARIERFRAFLDAEGAPEAASLEHASEAAQLALARLTRERLVTSFDDPDGRVWAVDVERRITLEFYKNQLLHWFAPAALAAVAVRPLPEGPFTPSDARAGFVDLAWVLRREFVLDPDVPASVTLVRGLDALVRHGALSREGDAYAIADIDRMGELYGLVRNLLEGYRSVLRHAERLLGRVDVKDLAKSLQGESDQLQAAGDVTRPEALSLVTLQNAVASFDEEGALRAKDGLRDRRLRTLDAWVL